MALSLSARIFRGIALAEGLSFLVLLGIAMPLKYAADMPLAVKLTGSAHGALFIAYLVAMVPLFVADGWPLRRAPLVVGAAFLPFGTFVLERKWLRTSRS